MTQPAFTREFAMPSKHTFTIKPIEELLGQEMDGEEWADPFSGWNSPANHTNDLNPEAPTTHHLEAEEFARCTPKELDGVLFDPPYSLRQIKEVYDSVGLKLMEERTRDAGFGDIKDILSRKVRLDGKAICFGWNSMGFGIQRGFKMERILLVPHGGPHNDTIVTVERKIQSQFFADVF
jgi:hypothetical protein|tara:strand:+ start:561 stop:1097 length:537 start_codon:yes stop_codon:yes gene_type:complete